MALGLTTKYFLSVCLRVVEVKRMPGSVARSFRPYAARDEEAVEALPVGHRPATRAALEAAGFTGTRLWRYMRAALPLSALPRAAQVMVGESDDPPGRRLEVRDGRHVVAEATVGRPVEGIGVLWWIGVEPDARGQGLAAAVLGSAMDVLADLGATEVILFVDDDAPPGDPERDRSAANRMYDRAGMTEVDRLYSFTRPQ